MQWRAQGLGVLAVLTATAAVIAARGFALAHLTGHAYRPAAGAGWQLLRVWGWLLRGYDFAEEPSEDLVPAIVPRPMLFIHGTADTIIPSEESEHLARRAGTHGELWLLPGVGHVGAIALPTYGERLRAFFEGGPPSVGQSVGQSASQSESPRGQR